MLISTSTNSKEAIMRKSSFQAVFALAPACLLLVTSLSFAQLKTPQVSPYASAMQRIGLTDVTITYHRPAVKDREIWGKLVPYGFAPPGPVGNGKPFPWRAGANENTTISFTDDVMIEGKLLPAGTYGLHMIPSEGDWTIAFSKNSSSWGSFFYDENEDALRVTVTPQQAEHEEWLEYGFDDLTKNSAVAYLHWEKMKVPFKIQVNTDEVAINYFKDQLRGQLGFNWQNWNQAAFYCLQNNVHLDLGLEWVDKSISMNENPANRNIKAYLLMAQNRKDECLALFEENVEKYPDNWNVYDSMGEAYNNYGQKDKAVKFYKTALAKAPDGQKSRIEGILEKIAQN
jgi:tetratricopeptide (TPR) repeat protein